MNESADRIRLTAEHRVDARRRFAGILTAWIIVAVVTTAVWAITSGPGSYFWPAWPMFGVGIGVLVKGLRLIEIPGFDRESGVEREMERIRTRA